MAETCVQGRGVMIDLHGRYGAPLRLQKFNRLGPKSANVQTTRSRNTAANVGCPEPATRTRPFGLHSN